ncbi:MULTISPECIES: replication-relaxation family protein [Bacillaceae]|nr:MULTISPECIES: replication-relaxation family protein [Bacillaceae]
METMEPQETQEQHENKGVAATLIETTIETKATHRNKAYDAADVRQFTERNSDIDYKILLALYEHRALTSAQLKRGWFPHLHENSIRNRLKTLAERRVLTVNVKAGIKTSPVKLYSLSAFGLRILTENVLEVMEYVPQYDEKKEHYTIDDLKVRSQHNHHYELQEWVMNIRAKRPELFHCEWKRFPFVEEEEDTVRVKPDWLFLEADEATKERTKQNVANNPLLYPYFYRKDAFPDISLQPILCVECDRGNMSRTELVDKWEGYKKLPESYKPKAISVFYTPKKAGDMRHRMIRDTLSHAFELEVIQNHIQLFQGDPQLTHDISMLYFERDKELLRGEEMIDEEQFTTLFKGYVESSNVGEASILDVDKTIERFKLPVQPDAIIMKQQESPILQIVFYGMYGWVNPIIKIQAIKRWLKEGHLSMFSEIQYILIYPNDSFYQDVRTMDDDIFYVSYEEIKGSGKWGKARHEQRKHRQVKWVEVLL